MIENAQFADIILPFAVKGRFTYKVPDALMGKLARGMRVIVPFRGNSFCEGIIYELHDNEPQIRNLKSVKEAIDETPMANEIQLKLWDWMSEYYMCCEGEIMKAALPSATSLENYRPKFETYVRLAKDYSESELNTDRKSTRLNSSHT